MKPNQLTKIQLLRNIRILIIAVSESVHEEIKQILANAEYGKTLLEPEQGLFAAIDTENSYEVLNYEIDDAFNCDKALVLVEKAETEKNAYSLVFIAVDAQISGANAVATIRQIWQKNPHVQIVLCSASPDHSLAEITTKFGRTDKLIFLEVPINPLMLKQITMLITSKWLLQRSSLNLIDTLRRANVQSNLLLTSIQAVLVGVGPTGLITHWNETAEKTFGIEAKTALAKDFSDLKINWDWQKILACVEACSKTTRPHQLSEVRYVKTDGKDGFLDITMNPITDPDHTQSGLLLLANDVTERKILEAKLSQAQKLESIGQLAAGIAHEINTPIQYIGDNTKFLKDAFNDLTRLLSMSRACTNAVKQGKLSDAFLQDLESAIEDADLEYLMEEIPLAIEQSTQGIERVTSIVGAMKTFSHPGANEKSLININNAIKSTITIARNEWRYVAEMVTDFAESLPFVPCFPGDFNQVILNIVINAAHSIKDVVKNTTQKGIISISTRQAGDHAVIKVSDTGAGIAPEIISKIYDPFFTTKEVGKGTGQGLAYCHNVIVEKHQGLLSVDTEVGKGSTFTITLPLNP